MFVLYMSFFESDEDKQIFAEFYERMRWKGYAIAYKLVKEKYTAEDVLHFAFMKIIEHKEKFFSFDCNKQEAYFVTTIKNKAIDVLRTSKKLKSLDEMGESAGRAEELADIDNDVAIEVENSDGLDRLVALIQTLPVKYRTVFDLRYIHDLSYEEIAETLGISVNLVGVRLLRSKEMLAKLIKEGGDGYGGPETD